jgi:hypothetical protein
MENPKRMNKKQKRATFRKLAQQPRIQTGRQLAEAREQPYLPLINDCLAGCGEIQRPRPCGQSVPQKKIGFPETLARAAAIRRPRANFVTTSDGEQIANPRFPR